MIPRWKAVPLVGTMALAVVAGACSSSSNHASTSPTTGASSAISGASSPSSAATGAQTTAAPIKVALICTCSGAFGGSEIPAEDTYKAWVNTINGSGGINGHRIQLSTSDDGGVPGTSIADIHTILAGNPDAIVDMSIVDDTWSATVQAANVPVVGADETEIPFYTKSDFYPEGETLEAVDYAKVATAKTAGATNLAYFYCAESVDCAESVPGFAQVGAKLGVPMVFKTEIAATAPNYTAQCLAANQAHVTGIYIGDGAPIIARVGQNCLQQGYKPIYIIDGEAYGPQLETAPGIEENLWAPFGTLPYFDNTPAVQTMNAAVDKYYPGLRTSANWNEIAAESWASGLLLDDALKGGGLTSSATPSPAEITAGLQSLKGDTLDGWAPPLTFAAGQPHPVTCWFTVHESNGVPALVNNGQASCESGTSS
jgi:branched-chain amino acid transport system substrate-binding protein